MIINYETNIEKVLNKLSNKTNSRSFDLISKEMSKNILLSKNQIIFEKLNPKKIFHIQDIKKVCVDYRLRFFKNNLIFT